MLYQDTVAKVLTEYENIFPLPEHIPLKCELYSSLIVKSAEITMGTRPSTKESKNNLKNKPSPTLHKLWQKLKKSFEKWKFKGKCRDPMTHSSIAIGKPEASSREGIGTR